MYVTQDYDFHDAITKVVRSKAKTQWVPVVVIDSVNSVDDNSAIVRTNHGDWFCESGSGDDGTIYMKITPFIN